LTLFNCRRVYESVFGNAFDTITVFDEAIHDAPVYKPYTDKQETPVSVKEKSNYTLIVEVAVGAYVLGS